MMQWYTTFQHFRPWATFQGGVCLFGLLRAAKPVKREKGLHSTLDG